MSEPVISKTTFVFTVLHRTDEPFMNDDPLREAMERAWDGHAVGQITDEHTESVAALFVEMELKALGNDGTFFDDDLGMNHD